ncbi:MAG: LytTR family transcriptional regulator [Paludibacteraceae bacterium]|nr:LytTR family transcriptional regulator [Paludibacteraceae bacterium]
MKLFVKTNSDVQETEVTIRCRERDEEVENIISGIHSSIKQIIGEKDNGDSCQVALTKVLYFEALEGNVFAYLEQSVIRVKNTLYELEYSYKNHHFIRISKSAVVNLRAIKNIKPEEGRRLILELKNSEHLVVSKNYVSVLKKALCMKEDKK